MCERFDFDAPQFADYKGASDPFADRFFDIQPALEEIKLKTSEKLEEMEVMGENIDPAKVTSFPVKTPPTTRPVLTEITSQAGNIQSVAADSPDTLGSLSEKIGKLKINPVSARKSRLPVRATQVFDGLVLEPPKVKPHGMATRMDTVLKTPVLKLRSRSVVRSDDEVKSPPVSSTCDNSVSSTTSTATFTLHVPTKRMASPLQSTRKYLSLAEQVQQFHKATPDRFRSKPRHVFVPGKPTIVKPCVPKTPPLRAVHRIRPSVFLSQEQREEEEMLELAKHTFKAHPVNDKIMKAASLNLKAPVEKKPTTVPEPFNLTELKKKGTSQPDVYHFKAQPVPTRILQATCGVPAKKVLALTDPQTPHIRVPKRLRVAVQTPPMEGASSTDSLNKPRNTQVQPFSFDEKMREASRRKAESIRKVIDEEKKLTTSFKARAVPVFTLKAEPKALPHLGPTEVKPFKLTQPKQREALAETPRMTPFKAQPAKTIHMKPFVPKLERPHTPLPPQLHLHTEERATKRHQFDVTIREQERKNENLLSQQRVEEERRAQQEVLEMRKMAEFKAHPVRKFKAVEIHGADPSLLTSPHSPQFKSGKKKEHAT